MFRRNFGLLNIVCMYYVERGYYFLFLRVLLILLSHQQLHKTVLTSHLKREEKKTKTLFLLSNKSYTDLYKDLPGLASALWPLIQSTTTER